MNIIKFSIICLLLLSGCHKITVEKEFSTIQKATKEMTGAHVFLHDLQPKPLDDNVLQQIDEGISRNQAIGIALMNNPELQANFETLGVAKADLEQAGLYSNPDVHGFFWPPLKGKRMELETGSFYKISDFWQVPLRKKVEKDVLESVTFQILESVLEIMKQTRMAYDKVLFAQKQLMIVEDILKQSIDLRDNIYYRQEFGFSSDLDRHLADVTIGNSRLEVIRIQSELSQAYIILKKVLGIPPTPEPIKLTEQLDGQVESFKKMLPPLDQLQEWALIHRPEILNAHMKIKQFKDTITYEKSKVWSTVNAGVSFKRDFDGSRGIGPNFELSLPIFDQNQAQVARAEFLLAHAKKQLLAVQLEIQKDVQRYYIDFINTGKEIDVYSEAILPSNTKALDYTNKFEQVMQITMVVLLQTKTALFQNRVRATEVYYHALDAFTHLERAVGKRIDLLASSSAEGYTEKNVY